MILQVAITQVVRYLVLMTTITTLRFDLPRGLDDLVEMIEQRGARGTAMVRHYDLRLLTGMKCK